MGYDFSKLNDKDFEALGASVIEKLLGKRVEIFKAGRDAGVDGRFWIGSEGASEGIIQCKHFMNTPYKTMIKKLMTEEAPKVNKLKPGRYIFITSQKLSRANKAEIKEIFQPHIIREDDILGREDLDIFLSKRENQDVVEQNYKLWITSAPVLDLIFNNAIKGRSKSTIRDIEENAHKYALTQNHSRGLRILEKNNVVIITGEPGIGKTTLADNLALYYTAKGYEFCDIEENISEAESLFRENEEKNILFYCDDFLGSNLYDAINNKKDSHIANFIARVSRDNTKKFILTSRTNILNKAFSVSHKFQNSKIRDNEFLLTVENLTALDKAHILYNHIYYSALDKVYIDQIYENKRYREIIRHRNFNPRIIEFITDSNRLSDVAPEDYWNFVWGKLEKPEEIWADYFQNQTDDSIRALIFLTVYNKGKISEEDLRRSYSTFMATHRINLGDHTDKSFEAVRKLAVRSLLNRNQVGENKFEYTLFNPSIADYILSSYSAEDMLVCDILTSLVTEDSLRYFNTLSISNVISRRSREIIQEKLFERLFHQMVKEENWDFLILLSYVNFAPGRAAGWIKEFIGSLMNAEFPGGDNLSELLMILTEFEPRVEFDNFEFLHNFIHDSLDSDTLKELTNFMERFNVEDDYILSQTASSIESYLKDLVDNNDLDINYSNHINHSYYPDGSVDYEIDIAGIESDVHENLESILDGFNGTVIGKIDINTSDIVSRMNIEDKATRYMESYGDDYYDDEMRGISNSGRSSQDDIDALFER